MIGERVLILSLDRLLQVENIASLVDLDFKFRANAEYGA